MITSDEHLRKFQYAWTITKKSYLVPQLINLTFFK